MRTGGATKVISYNESITANYSPIGQCVYLRINNLNQRIWRGRFLALCQGGSAYHAYQQDYTEVSICLEFTQTIYRAIKIYPH